MAQKGRKPTLSALVRNTPRNIQRTSRGVKQTRLIRSVKDVDEAGEHKRIVIRSLATTIWRDVVIKLYDEPHDMKSTCWVHCSCEYFLYFLEVANTVNGCSDLVYSNGRTPVIRNLQMRPYLCKHLLRAAPEAVKAQISTKRMTLKEKKILEQIGISPSKPKKPKKLKKTKPPAKRKTKKTPLKTKRSMKKR